MLLIIPGGRSIKISKGAVVALFIMAVGLALIVYSIYTGGSRFYLLLVVPVVASNDIFGALGIIILIIGFITLMVSISFSSVSTGLGSLADLADDEDVEIKAVKKRSKVRSGGMILIGPFPIVWGTDKKIGKNMLYVALIITVIMIVLTLIWVFISFYGA
jgi:uncharacterized protein (TIGR00304 family)